MTSSNAGGATPPEKATLDIRVQRWIEEKRGISAETAARFDVVTIGQYPAFEFRRASGLQYRKIRVALPDGEKSFQRDRKGAVTCLFLEHTIEVEQIEPDATLIITEGEIDALSFKDVCLPYVVSVPDGAQLDDFGKGKIVPEEDKPFSWLWEGDKLKPHIARFKRFIIATDADRKGKILREELAVRLDRWKCYFVEYPERCKDANETYLKHGRDAVLAIIENAKPVVPDNLISIANYHDIDTGEVFESGFKGIDGSPSEGNLGFSFVVPELCIITGEPGSGKSEFATILGANLAKNYEMPGAILQFEDRATRVYKTLERYAISNVAGVKDEVDSSVSRANARKWIAPRFMTIAPPENLDDPDFTLGWIKEAIREARQRHGCRWVLIDPWNEVEHLWDSRGMTEAAYINGALRDMKRIARAYQIILMIVAHPNVSGGRQRDIDEADLYGISGGSAWNNKADHGFILMRPDKAKSEVHIKLAKSKDHFRMGKPGTFTYLYEWASSSYRYLGAYRKEK